MPGVFINNAVRASFIFLDTVTASLNIVFAINFIDKKPNVPCLALSNLLSGSYQARAYSYLLKLLNLEK